MNLAESRLSLQEVLSSICDHVYFQPGASIKLTYPAIIYRLSGIPEREADNITYKTDHRYEVTLISKNPVDERVDMLVNLPQCVMNSYFVTDNLHHWAFTVYHY